VNIDIAQYDAPRESFDVAILSNVLEHIENRRLVLKKIYSLLKDSDGSRILIRVPQFNRDWITSLKYQRGVEWRLDPTHIVEYTHEALELELRDSGLKVIESSFFYGEIYVVAVKDSNSFGVP
jgi:2-polyprenyl-3-methyl-5-hydroxy-6-metoxy-1,4-benzoquinol methylase